MNILEKTGKSSPTTKLWVDVLIKLLVLCLLLIRAKQEVDWAFHLEAVKKMIPVFLAAGHVNYPRWEFPYLRRMKAFSDNVHSHFMKGEHTIQLSATPWSGIWSDMGIEVLYNRIGKRVAGIIGKSTNMKTVKVWAYSLNACCEVAECLDAIKTNLVPIICTKRRKNPEFHMISLTEIFWVKYWKFPLISLMPLSMQTCL